MRLLPIALAFFGIAGAASAQNAPAATSCSSASPVAIRDLRQRLAWTASRAVAYFRSADSIEDNLNSQGATLHPEIVVLKLQLQSALDDTHKAVDQCDTAAAGKAIERAQALLDRFAAKLGG